MIKFYYLATATMPDLSFDCSLRWFWAFFMVMCLRLAESIDWSLDLLVKVSFWTSSVEAMVSLVVLIREDLRYSISMEELLKSLADAVASLSIWLRCGE